MSLASSPCIARWNRRPKSPNRSGWRFGITVSIWDQRVATIGASIGVVAVTRESETVAKIMSAADIACYAAKDAGRNRVHVHSPDDASGRHREMYWVTRVTRALDEGRLELCSQPIMAMSAESLRLPPFHELLVRLRDDDGELALPGEFIPAAERHNVVGAIDRWVLQQAVARLQQFAARGMQMPLLAVNLSHRTLGEDDFLDFVLALVRDPAIARSLCFDIAEAAVLENASQTVRFMAEVRKLGCRIALDDFAAGLSTLQSLKRIPVDFLKFDGQMIGGSGVDPVDRSMVEAFTKVATALGIATIAECVETAESLARLTELGIDFAQGYHLARPAPLAEVISLMPPVSGGQP